MSLDKISPRQTMAMLIISRLMMATVLFPTLTELDDPQNIWLVGLLGMMVAIPLVLLIVALGLAFPDKTIVQYSQVLLGKFPGKIVGLLLVWYWFHIAVTSAAALGESLTSAIMVETPDVVLIGIIAYLGASAARNGVEVMARVAENALGIIVFFVLVTTILPFDVMKSSHLLPVLAGGWGSLVPSMMSAVSFFMEFTVVGMLIPYVSKPKQTVRYSVYAILTAGILLVFLGLTAVMVFGPSVKSLSMPVFSLARMISIGRFFERIEFIPMGAWIMCTSIKLSLFVWASSLGLAQVLGLSQGQVLIYPMGALVVAASIVFYEDFLVLIHFLTSGGWSVYSLGITLTTILLLCSAAFLRRLFGGGASGD
ncbi:MAG: GerAB/ArcD/ProY family transporter [Limnochordia bacterium]|jgi:spore germination protein KB|nr:endospore germination permease [Bacillota bacterium]